jgi:hypothetical protein
MAEAFQVGDRVRSQGHTATVRFVGPVAGTKGDWIGELHISVVHTPRIAHCTPHSLHSLAWTNTVATTQPCAALRTRTHLSQSLMYSQASSGTTLHEASTTAQTMECGISREFTLFILHATHLILPVNDNTNSKMCVRGKPSVQLQWLAC